MGLKAFLLLAWNLSSSGILSIVPGRLESLKLVILQGLLLQGLLVLDARIIAA